MNIIIEKLLSRIPGTLSNKRRNFLLDYDKKRLSNHKEIFLSISRFGHINRPFEGYYFEFGCHGGNTIKLAWQNFRFIFDLDYVCFDSFEGLPEISKIDRQKIWQKGKLRTTLDEFFHILKKIGLPLNKVKIIKGFYKESLNKQLQEDLLPKKAAVIYVDCDLYESTKDVLKFCVPFFREGTILIFDDWNCFNGSPEKGEKKAFGEFLAAHESLKFEDFISTNEQKGFICISKSHD